MGSTPLGGCIGYFLKFLFSNFRSHIKDSKWGRKYIFMNYTCCNGSRQKIPFQFANGKLPHSHCRAFWAVFNVTRKQYLLQKVPKLISKKNKLSSCPLAIILTPFQNCIISYFTVQHYLNTQGLAIPQIEDFTHILTVLSNDFDSAQQGKDEN